MHVQIHAGISLSYFVAFMLILSSSLQLCRELDGAVLKFTTREQPVRERVWNDMDEGKFHQAET